MWVLAVVTASVPLDRIRKVSRRHSGSRPQHSVLKTNEGSAHVIDLSWLPQKLTRKLTQAGILKLPQRKGIKHGCLAGDPQ